MTRNLDNKIYESISLICRRGDDLLGNGDAEAALRQYVEAWSLLPEPKHQWEAATWILSAIGDAHFTQQRFEDALQAFTNALLCPNGLGNPFIHLRLGQSFYELGDTQRAQDELARAYMGGGAELFSKEPPKYFASLKDVLDPPDGHDRL